MGEDHPEALEFLTLLASARHLENREILEGDSVSIPANSSYRV
jgi:hypothetical protein